jgi:hypothetical protein
VRWVGGEAWEAIREDGFWGRSIEALIVGGIKLPNQLITTWRDGAEV